MMREDINSWRSDARERSAMVEAPEEINDALDREDWVTAESQCQAAIGNWPDCTARAPPPGRSRRTSRPTRAPRARAAARRRRRQHDAGPVDERRRCHPRAPPGCTITRGGHPETDLRFPPRGLGREDGDSHQPRRSFHRAGRRAFVAQPRRFADCGAGWTRPPRDARAGPPGKPSAWRDAAPYSSLKCITVRTDWDLPADFGQRFCGVERLNVTSERFLIDDEGAASNAW